MEPLKERPDKVEDEKHLLLSFDQGDKPVFHQIKQTTYLKKIIVSLLSRKKHLPHLCET